MIGEMSWTTKEKGHNKVIVKIIQLNVIVKELGEQWAAAVAEDLYELENIRQGHRGLNDIRSFYMGCLQIVKGRRSIIPNIYLMEQVSNNKQYLLDRTGEKK